MGVEVAIGAIVALGAAQAAMQVWQGHQRAESIRDRAKAQASLASYNAAVAENQAVAAEQDAEAATRAAKIRALQGRERARYLKGAQEAAYAKAGVTTAGTPLLVMEETAANQEMDVLDVIYQGKLEERRHLITAGRFRQQAAIDLWQGQVAQKSGKSAARRSIIGGYTGAGLTLVQTAASVAFAGAAASAASAAPAAGAAGGVGAGAGGGAGVGAGATGMPIPII